jgi:NAD(P)H-hydrate epimerase
MVIDADGLNSIAGFEWRPEALRVLTPHPGEMARLSGKTTAEVQQNRLETARAYAEAHDCILVLKGHRTVIAMRDGRAWINPTGSPAMATGGTGDILTGLIAGLLAQFPDDPEAAVLAGVYLHGSCGAIGAADVGEKPLLATGLLTYLPEAIDACTQIPDEL